MNIFETTPIEERELLEIKKGFRKLNAKYVSRFGSPGHYIYVYMPKGLERMSRRAKFAYGRIVKRSKKFLDSIKTRYDASSLTVKPKTWHTAIVKLTTKDNVLAFHVNLKSHSIYSYRSKRGQNAAFVKMTKAKKAGLLRYR